MIKPENAFQRLIGKVPVMRGDSRPDFVTVGVFDVFVSQPAAVRRDKKTFQWVNTGLFKADEQCLKVLPVQHRLAAPKDNAARKVAV